MVVCIHVEREEEICPHFVFMVKSSFNRYYFIIFTIISSMFSEGGNYLNSVGNERETVLVLDILNWEFENDSKYSIRRIVLVYIYYVTIS